MRRLAWAGLLLMAGCTAGGGPAPVPPAPGVKVGKPYVINGETYTPRVQEDYDETGIASWYGPGFHGKYTANGEVFNQEDITAAHATLPIPCLVRVTNLRSGKSLVVRVNDRGPFKDKRIIDLSKASAEKLGIKGTARVRVQYLKQETESYWASRNMSTPTLASLEPVGIPQGNAPLADTVQEAEGEPAPIMTVSSNELAQAPAPRYEALETGGPQPQQTFRSETETAALPPMAEVTEEGWYVQAGAFTSEQNARALAEKLKNLSAVSVSAWPADGVVFHRVRLGPLASRAEAERLVGAATELGVDHARVLKE